MDCTPRPGSTRCLFILFCSLPQQMLLLVTQQNRQPPVCIQGSQSCGNRCYCIGSFFFILVKPLNRLSFPATACFVLTQLLHLVFRSIETCPLQKTNTAQLVPSSYCDYTLLTTNQFEGLRSEVFSQNLTLQYTCLIQLWSHTACTYWVCHYMYAQVI